MKYNIYLDDRRQPKQSYSYTFDKRYIELEWILVKNYDEFVNIIKNKGLNNIDLISFDHDLADEHYFVEFRDPWAVDDIDYMAYKEKTGYDCAKWLCDYALENDCKLPEILVHSFNQQGSDNIRYYIRNFIKHTSNEK